MKTRESGMPNEASWDQFFDPWLILEKLGVTAKCEHVVEFGCGYGTFTIPTAKIISGVVFAFDIEPDMVATTQAKAEAEGLANVQVQLRDFVTDGTGLPDGQADYALLFNILHAERPELLIKEAHRVLRPGGHVAIIHWNRDPSTPRGPSMDIRPSPEQCRTWAEAVGFQSSETEHIDLPPYHYGLILRK